MVPSFPKIFAIGSRQTERLFAGKVEITEKIDGSQIGFGVINGELCIRSKGSQIIVDEPEKMFKEGVEVIKALFEKGLLQEGFVYYGEYLKTERHNIIKYGRIPKNHIALFAAVYLPAQTYFDYASLKKWSECLDLDVVPLIFEGQLNSVEELKDNVNRISGFGKEKIEGFVVKNYAEQLIIGGQVLPILMGKFVSEDFKEVHKREWKSENTAKGKWEVFKSQFKSNARWVKAIHYLRDTGQLTQSPKDIGALLKHIQHDILSEETDAIKDFLFNEFKAELLRTAVNGFPEWYKEYLLSNAVIG